jgi:hypothetical protein
MAKAIRNAKRKLLPKPAKRRRARLDRTDRYQIECIVSSGARAETLLKETWHRVADLPHVMVSAILRDLLIEIGHVHRAGQNLAEAFLDRGEVSA